MPNINEDEMVKAFADLKSYRKTIDSVGYDLTALIRYELYKWLVVNDPSAKLLYGREDGAFFVTDLSVVSYTSFESMAIAWVTCTLPSLKDKTFRVLFNRTDRKMQVCSYELYGTSEPVVISRV